MVLRLTVPMAVLANLSTDIAAAPTSCTPGPYIIFFEEEMPYVDREARHILDTVMDNVGDCGYGHTIVAGHADTKESPKLARRRAEVVRDFIAAHGVPRSDVVVQSFGSGRQRITTGPGVSERQNRRVEIMFSVR